MESAISIFRKLPETKSQVKKYAQLIKSSVLDGEVEPLQFAAQITALESLFKSLKSDYLIKDLVLEEAEKYGSKSFKHGNANFIIKEVGITYDFTNCMDVEWEEMNTIIKRYTEKKKERETFLKTINPNIEVYGSDGVQLNPPVKKSTTSVVIILK